MFATQRRQVGISSRIVIGLSSLVLLLVCQQIGLGATAVRQINEGQAHLSAAIAKVDAVQGRSDGEGFNSDSNAPRVVELGISFNVEGQEELMGPLGKDIRSISVSGIVGEIPGGLRVENFSARVSSYQTGGTVEVLFSGDRPRILARLSSEELNFAIAPRPAGTEAEGQTSSGDRKIPDVGLPFSVLRDMDADVELELSVGALRLDHRTIKHAQILLSVIDGAHANVRLVGEMFGGGLNADAEIDPSEGDEMISLRVEGRGLQPELMPVFHQDGEPIVTGAITDVNVRLNSRGSDLRELASKVNGIVLVDSKAGKIENNATNLVGASLLYTLSQAINPFARSDKVTELQCAVAHFDLKDGVATASRGIAMQTTKVDVIASGVIDLDTEAIDFSAKPVAKQGLGISLSPVASIVRVRGTISKPQFAIGAKAAALRIGAGIGTGGISVLAEGLYSSLAADPTACATARQPVDSRKSRGALQSATDSGAGAVEKVTTGAGDLLKDAAAGTGKAAKEVTEGAGAVIKGAGRAATKVFRGIFGNEERKESQNPETSDAPP